MKPLNLIYAFDCSVAGEESFYKLFSVLLAGGGGGRALVLRDVTERSL